MNNAIQNGILPGYSDRADDPALLRGVGKFNWYFRLIFLALLVAPLVLFGLLANGIYFAVGICLSAIFLLAYLIWEIKRIVRKPWEGVITEKFTKVRNYFSVTSSIVSHSRSTRYYLQITQNDGKTKTKKVDNAIFYEYLNEGDRVRFLPRLSGYYEKYDKSHDTYLICPACLKKNVSVNDRCAHCGIILLK